MARFRHRLPASLVGVSALGLAVALTSAFPLARQAVKDRPWIGYSSAADGSRFFPNSQITKANVNRLEVAWTYPFSDTVSTPMMARGMIYGRGRNGALVALDAKTGKEIWVREGMDGMTSRGINYWESADGSDRRLLFAMNDYLQEIDARTGKLITTFGDNGVVDLRDGLGRDPATIARIQSQHARTGVREPDPARLGAGRGLHVGARARARLRRRSPASWCGGSTPSRSRASSATTPGRRTPTSTSARVNTWGELSVDVARGIAYFPTGSPTYDYYGADRPGREPLRHQPARARRAHRQAALALPARAPRPVGLRHQLGAAADDHRQGRQAPRRGGAGRQDRLPLRVRPGDRRADLADRRTARADERDAGREELADAAVPHRGAAVQQADLHRRRHQPASTTSRPRSARRSARRVRGTKNLGMFTPIDFIDTLHIPGSNGGSVFGTAASEPGTGMVYVIGQNNPGILRLMRTGEPRNRFGGAATPGEVVYQRDCAELPRSEPRRAPTARRRSPASPNGSTTRRFAPP